MDEPKVSVVSSIVLTGRADAASAKRATSLMGNEIMKTCMVHCLVLYPSVWWQPEEVRYTRRKATGDQDGQNLPFLGNSEQEK